MLFRSLKISKTVRGVTQRDNDHLFDFKLSNANILINIPVAIVVFFAVSKPYATRAMVYLISFSASLMLLDMVDLSAFVYSTTISTLLGPVVAGMISGVSGYYMDKMGSCTGGTDFISAIVHKRNPNKSVLGFSFTLNVFVALASYFVYGFQMEPVILCILYSFMSSTVGERLQKSGREAICFEIIIDFPLEITGEIIARTGHSTTLIPAKGMYSGKNTNMLVCVVNKTQVAAVIEICRSYPNTFTIMDPVGQVVGNFKNMSEKGREVIPVLDSGDGKTL